MFSLMYPKGKDSFRQLSPVTCHDLGIDTVCKALTDDREEQRMIHGFLSEMSADPYTAQYRHGIFSDIMRLPELRSGMTALFDKLEYLSDYGMMKKNSGERLGIWYLLHRLEELNSYIECVEAMRDILSEQDIRSDGLTALREHVNSLYEEQFFAEMKKDISALRMKTSDIRSVTLGINLNERFEAVSMGLVSVNSKHYKRSGIVGAFSDAVAGDRINSDIDKNNDMHYHLVGSLIDEDVSGFEKVIPFRRSTLVSVPDGDGMKSSTYHLNEVMNRMIDRLVKSLSETLSKYVNIAVMDIRALIPEFVFFIRFAEFTESSRSKGYAFCDPETGDIPMDARGFYNLRLAVSVEDSIVPNDLVFDSEHTIYILTGANRGGKTTLTQAVGLLFLLAQGGVCVPAESFVYTPVDCIYTHFPADEDKTMDLGRLGEECVRFKEIYTNCTDKSLILLNETFSTTSFEEGYYIARDSVKALLLKGTRTIYNTHMHKLAADADTLGTDTAKAASLVVRTENGSRSFRAVVAPPEGMSFARDIAEKYGVTYEMLTGGT